MASLCGGIQAAEVPPEASLLTLLVCVSSATPPAGGARSHFHPPHTQSMGYSNPELLDALLSHLADQMASYIKYQIESGAQCVQVRGYHVGRGERERGEGI